MTGYTSTKSGKRYHDVLRAEAQMERTTPL